MNVSRWHMYKIGLVDFWCYENETFTFENGHMLLRGSNGSGKSVTMQSFIPLLLDGNRSSERLDPFGTRSRKMDTYLIDENSDREERIGYLYLEFKREDSDLFKTIGMGLRARKNRSLQTWYFIIEDGRRIGIDFQLIDNGLTLSERQLKNILGEQVISSQREYMRRVNESLFGFESLEEYSDAIDLLLQLRSPKLSNSLSPAKINEILRTSLQPLSDEDLRPMSEAIANMDNLHDQLESLQQSQHAADDLAKVYRQYNEVILADKWQKYQREHQSYHQIEIDITTLQKNQEAKEIQKEKLERDTKENRINHEILLNEQKILQNNDMQKWLDDLSRLEKEIDSLSVSLKNKEKSYEKKEEFLFKSRDKVREYEDKMVTFERSCKDMFDDLTSLNENLNFSEHIALELCLREKQRNFDFNYTRSYLQKIISELQEALSIWQQYDQQLHTVEFYQEQSAILSSTIEKIQSLIDKAKSDYRQQIEIYLEFIYQYQETNQLFKLTEYEIGQIRDLLISYETTKDYMQIQEVVRNAFDRYLSQYNETFSQLSHQKLLIEETLQDRQKELRYWENVRDPQPDRKESSLKHRSFLDEKQVPYLPFYQLLNFSDEISEGHKNRIEELFLRLNLLDALVIPKKYQNVIKEVEAGCHDFYLWKEDENLLDQTVEISRLENEQDLYALFQQLEIQTDASMKIEERFFKNGVTEGVLADNYTSVYIGFERRQKLKKEKIQILLEEIRQQENLLVDIGNQISECESCKSLLKREYEDFIKENDLKEAYSQIEMQEREYVLNKEKLDKTLQQEKNEKKKLDSIQQALAKYASKYMLPIQKEAFITRMQDYQDYQNTFEKFKDSYRDFLHFEDALIFEKEKYDELLADLDDLKYERDMLQENLTVGMQNRQTLQQRLEESGYTDLVSRLKQVAKQIQLLEDDYIHLKEDISAIQTEMVSLGQTLEIKCDELVNQKERMTVYKDIFQQELSYHLVIQEDLADKELAKQMRGLVNQRQNKKSIADYQGQLQKIFFEQNSYLVTYRVFFENRPLCHEVEDIPSCLVLYATYQGKKIPFLELLVILHENVETQKLLIQQEDRLIFEEILVNTIGKKIRDRIQASKRWIAKIDRYMSDMNTSSGLKLSIRWKSRKALDDQEMDSVQLVELLEKDSYVLKDVDRKNISQHFRSKIDKARRDSLDEQSAASFHQLMREIMDYRLWFDFTLYAQKPRENKKELTTHVFHAYSGGEKAISMYVPLFSAVAAKFESARKDAPLLIALDEAFAGVDENNIDNMFELITKFGFDYIMNSQVLWGDYASCPSLAIYELFRPNDAPYVTVVGYTWNGKHKQVMLP